MKLKKKEYTTPAEKKKDFWLGFGLFFALNVVLFLMNIALVAVTGLLMRPGSDFPRWVPNFIGTVAGLLPYLINLVVVILLAVTRSQMALGFVVGIAAAFALILVLGVVFAVVCYLAVSQG